MARKHHYRPNYNSSVRRSIWNRFLFFLFMDFFFCRVSNDFCVLETSCFQKAQKEERVSSTLWKGSSLNYSNEFAFHGECVWMGWQEHIYYVSILWIYETEHLGILQLISVFRYSLTMFDACPLTRDYMSLSNGSSKFLKSHQSASHLSWSSLLTVESWTLELSHKTFHIWD